MYGRIMAAESVAAQVVNALASPETVRRIAITPHYPRAEDGDDGDETWESQLAAASESDES